jgi:hypothetical protein
MPLRSFSLAPVEAQQAVEFLVRGVLASVDYIGAGVFGRGGSRCSSRSGDAAVVS